jgi:hypothetical protein
MTQPAGAGAGGKSCVRAGAGEPPGGARLRVR